MTRVAKATIADALADNWVASGPKNKRYQALMADLGVSDDAIEAAIAIAEGTEGVISAKISGSGLGDCVVAIGSVPQGFVPVTLAQKGVIFHDAP
ncbi:MAG: hypothetical protein AAFP98_01975 [Pseudomonadota bacterium]